MLTLPTAKVLLFIALNVGPRNAPEIYATSNSENYVWTSTGSGWVVEAKGFPASDWTRDPSREVALNGSPTERDMIHDLRRIARHDWSHDSVLIFDNGDRVEKCGDHAFYTINAGGANEKTFTILFSKRD